MLRAVMHGYYMDLRLYNKAKLIANPFDYTDFMKRKVQQKITEDNQRGIQTKVKESNTSHAVKLQDWIESFPCRQHSPVSSHSVY